jgi:hypothetical protein
VLPPISFTAHPFFDPGFVSPSHPRDPGDCKYYRVTIEKVMDNRHWDGHCRHNYGYRQNSDFERINARFSFFLGHITHVFISFLFWPLISEDVLKMVGAKRATIFPFRIASTIALANGDPAMPAHGLSWAGIGLFKPGDV